MTVSAGHAETFDFASPTASETLNASSFEPIGMSYLLSRSPPYWTRRYTSWRMETSAAAT